MSGCIDKHFENMLHAYETGMLKDVDRQEFELHLLECQHCFERAQKMESATELMRYDTDVPGVFHRIVEEQSKAEAEISRKKTATPFLRRLWPALVPTSAVAAVVLLFLILKPWHLEFRPSQEAIASENRLVIMHFENLATPGDPQKLGEIATNLLIADLSESHYLQVVSSQRLYDILNLLGREETEVIDRETATQVAQKAEAKWMLMGSVLQEEPQFILTAQIVEITSGDVIASQHVTGEEGEDIFSLVDRLTVQVKYDLSLPMAARQEPDRRVADVTTHSPLAYRYYLEGIVNHHRYYNAEAAESFEKALEIDSTFAMVYYYLSLIKDQSMIAGAVEYSEKASHKERYYIRSREALLSGNVDQAISELQDALERYPDEKEAYYHMGGCYRMQLDFEKAIQCYNKAVEIDPLYKTVYNQMAYTFDWMGNFEKSIQAIDMYISLAPQEANPYDSRGDIYTNNGRLELAIDSYTKALEIKPDFWTSLYKLGKNNLFIREFTKADSCFRILASCDDPSWRTSGMLAEAYVPLCQGRFDEVIRIIDESTEVIRADADGREYASLHYVKAIAFEEKDNLSLALKEIEESIRLYRQQSPESRNYNQHFLAQLLAQTGEVESAAKVTEEFKENLGFVRDTSRYWYAVASIELSKGNLDEAIAGFEKAAEDTVIPYTPAYCMLASAYMEAGRWSDAIEELEGFQADVTDTRLFYGSWTAKVHYYLGMAHEELGRSDIAVIEYQTFLDMWKDADPGLRSVDDARVRLARLRKES